MNVQPGCRSATRCPKGWRLSGGDAGAKGGGGSRGWRIGLRLVIWIEAAWWFLGRWAARLAHRRGVRDVANNLSFHSHGPSGASNSRGRRAGAPDEPVRHVQTPSIRCEPLCGRPVPALFKQGQFHDHGFRFTVSGQGHTPPTVVAIWPAWRRPVHSFFRHYHRLSRIFPQIYQQHRDFRVCYSAEVNRLCDQMILAGVGRQTRPPIWVGYQRPEGVEAGTECESFSTTCSR